MFWNSILFSHSESASEIRRCMTPAPIRRRPSGEPGWPLAYSDSAIKLIHICSPTRKTRANVVGGDDEGEEHERTPQPSKRRCEGKQIRLPAPGRANTSTPYSSSSFRQTPTLSNDHKPGSWTPDSLPHGFSSTGSILSNTNGENVASTGSDAQILIAPKGSGSARRPSRPLSPTKDEMEYHRFTRLQEEKQRREEAYTKHYQKLEERLDHILSDHEQREISRDRAQADVAHRTEREKKTHRIQSWLRIIAAAFPLYIWITASSKSKAGSVLEAVFTRMWYRKWRCRSLRRKRNAALQTEIDLMRVKKPTAEQLAEQHEFFALMPRHELNSIIVAKMTPYYAFEGENIFIEGDPSFCMYIVHKGIVSVRVKKTDSASKRRSLENCISVATLVDGHYFGEASLLSHTPRLASVTAEKDTILWSISKNALYAVIEAANSKAPCKPLPLTAIAPSHRRSHQMGPPPDLRRILLEISDRSRMCNMPLLHPVTCAQLQKVAMFATWRDDQLTELIAGFQPFIGHKGDLIIKEGDPPDYLYFIAKGLVEVFTEINPPVLASSRSLATPSTFPPSHHTPHIRPPPSPATPPTGNHHAQPPHSGGGSPTSNTLPPINDLSATPVAPDPSTSERKQLAILTSKRLFGEVGCLFLEPRCASVQCLEECDLWRIGRGTLRDCLLSNALGFHQAKEAVVAVRSRWIAKLNPKTVHSCSFFRSKYPDRTVRQRMVTELTVAAAPRVYAVGEALCERRTRVDELIFIAKGSAQSAFAHHTVYHDGSVLGTAELEGEGLWTDTVKASTKLEAWTLSKRMLRRLFEEFPPKFPDEVSSSQNASKTRSKVSADANAASVSSTSGANLPNNNEVSKWRLLRRLSQS